MGKRRQILERDEIKLILNSEEVKDEETYGNLYQVLFTQGAGKGLHLNDITGMNTLASRIISDNIENMKERVVSEWRVINSKSFDANMKTKCSLCGTPNKYIFYIRNSLNGIELNVGSVCMKNFSQMEGYKVAKEKEEKERVKQEVIRKTTEFREYFSEAFPLKGTDIFEAAEEFYKKLPILLSSGLDKRFNSCIQEMKEVYKLFINSKISKKKAFDKFKGCLEIYSVIRLEIERFVTENEKNFLSCKRREIAWLIDKKQNGILQMIRENGGAYSLQTMKYICSPEFMFEHRDIFENDKSEGLFFWKEINDQKIIFTYEGRYILQYAISLKDYMQLFGANCLMKPDYRYNDYDLLGQKRFVMENTTDNKEVVVGVLNAQLKAIGGTLAYDKDFDKLRIVRLDDNAAKILDIKQVIELFSRKEILIDNNYKNLLNSYQRLLRSDVNWLDKKEQKRLLPSREQNIIEEALETAKLI